MRNVDWYKEELIKMANESNIVQIDTGFVDRVISGSLGMDTMTARRATQWFVKWLYEEHKFKLNKWEHLIFKYIIENTEYRYIARDRNNDLYIYENLPTKLDNSWSVCSSGGDVKILDCFNDLFLFVRWEDSEPTSIEDVLGNCEVIEDESSK